MPINWLSNQAMSSVPALMRNQYGQGLRSAMQLQLQDDETLWFSPDRNRAVGGLRTTVYNNVVRVDNVQHTLMAVMKIVGYINDVESERMQTDVSLGSLLPN